MDLPVAFALVASNEPLPVVAQRARRAAEWLGEDVLRRSVPLPGKLRLRHAQD